MQDLTPRMQRVYVRGLLIHNGQVLIVEEVTREISPGEYYDLPGGVVSFGREPAETLEMFFYEQTRIPVTAHKPFRVTHRIIEHGATQVIEITYRVAMKSSSNNAVRTFPKTKWVPVDDTGYFFSSRIRESIELGMLLD